ncbi:MAG: AAA family ATPase [Xenococcaceae cyanobacterium]
MLIGLPGSGKSSLAEQLVAKSPGSQVISTDAIRAQLFGNEGIQGPWLFVWRRVQLQFSHAVEQINLGQIPEAIYDATNARRRHRKEAIALARATGFTEIIGIWVDTPLQLCLERNRRRDRTVPEEVILRMHRQLQDAPPALDDGLDQLIRHSSTTSTEIAIASVSKNRT